MIGSRIFVALIFGVLATSFVGSIYVLVMEFGQQGWFQLAAVYSHAFLFFPTIGLVALIAFYTPATIFVDLYWHHVNNGPLRLLVGFLIIGSLSVYIAGILSGKNILFETIWKVEQPTSQPTSQAKVVPAIWELHPQTLAKDIGTPAGCATDDQLCARQPVMRSVSILRRVSQSRTGLTAFARNCSRDPLLENPPSDKLLRYCFPLLRKVDAKSCCFAQERFSRELSDMYTQEKQHSQTGYIHALSLPFKVFFMLMILLIGGLLAAWRAKLDRFYESYMPSVENGVLIGATAMLFWPVTNQAFLQSAATLYGPYSGSVYQNSLGATFSIVFGFWALLILFFFFRHQEKTVELWVKMLGAIGSVIAAVSYNFIIDYAVRFSGSGTYKATFVVLALVGLLVYISSHWWPTRKSSDTPKSSF